MKQRHLLFACRCVVAATLALITLCGHPVEPQQRGVRVGFVHPQSPSTAARGTNAFWERLHELGYVEGQNLVIEARWAEGQYERLPALMSEVLASNVDVVVTYSTQGAVVAKNATSTVPVVAVAMGEPLRIGLTTSLAQPGGNLTGLSALAEGIGGKWLELLQETVPRLSSVAVIANLANPIAQELANELEAVAPTRSLKLRLIDVRAPGALDQAFGQAARKAQAAVVLPDTMISARIKQVTALAAKYRIPTMYYLRDFVDAGGLVAFAPDVGAQFRRAADYVDKILKGAKPAELPIEQPTHYLLVVNLKTARALGLKIPESLKLRADEVIQ